MKVVCINNAFYGGYLTIDKIYDVLAKSNLSYNIINDKLNDDWAPQIYFRLLSEIRNEKIDKLLGI